MTCEKCTASIDGNDVYHFKGKTLCDDCYIDLVMGVPAVDLSRFPLELQCRFRQITKHWNRNRLLYHQIRFT